MRILLFLVFGFVVGLIAQAILPGRQQLGLVKTTLLGAGGSFIGGILGNLISGGPFFRISTAGWIGSILGAVILLAVLSRRR